MKLFIIWLNLHNYKPLILFLNSINIFWQSIYFSVNSNVFRWNYFLFILFQELLSVGIFVTPIVLTFFGTNALQNTLNFSHDIIVPNWSDTRDTKICIITRLIKKAASFDKSNQFVRVFTCWHPRLSPPSSLMTIAFLSIFF